MLPVKIRWFVILFLICGKTILVSSNGRKCLTNLLTEKQNQCKIKHAEAACYVESALLYRTSQSNYLPLWIELCFFQVPQFFSANMHKFSCTIDLDFGPVSCMPKESFTSDTSLYAFERKCHISLLWQDSLSFPTSIILDLVLKKCVKEFKEVWNNTDYIYAADRYLLSKDVAFSNSTLWMLIEKAPSTIWNVWSIVLVTAGSFGILLGLAFCVFHVKTRVCSVVKRNLSLENDMAIKQLDTILSDLDNSVNDTTHSQGSNTPQF